MLILYIFRTEAVGEQVELKANDVTATDREHLIDPPKVPDVSCISLLLGKETPTAPQMHLLSAKIEITNSKKIEAYLSMFCYNTDMFQISLYK